METKDIYQHGYEDGLYDDFNKALRHQEEYLVGYRDGNGDRDLFYLNRAVRPGDLVDDSNIDEFTVEGDIITRFDTDSPRTWRLDPLKIYLGAHYVKYPEYGDWRNAAEEPAHIPCQSEDDLL